MTSTLQRIVDVSMEQASGAEVNEPGNSYPVMCPRGCPTMSLSTQKICGMCQYQLPQPPAPLYGEPFRGHPRHNRVRGVILKLGASYSTLLLKKAEDGRYWSHQIGKRLIQINGSEAATLISRYAVLAMYERYDVLGYITESACMVADKVASLGGAKVGAEAAAGAGAGGKGPG